MSSASYGFRNGPVESALDHEKVNNEADEQNQNQAGRHLHRESKVAPECVHDAIFEVPRGFFMPRFGRIMAATKLYRT